MLRVSKQILVVGILSSFSLWGVASPGSVFATSGSLIRVLVLNANEVKLRSDGSRNLFVRGLDRSTKKVRSLKIVNLKGNPKFVVNGAPYEKGKGLTVKDINLRVSSNDPRGIWLGNRRYRGELRILFYQSSFKVINYLGISKYLSSVVASEMPKSWPMAALKAQAIASRTYALKQINKKEKESFDITSNEANQVYLGIESETPRSIKAVNSTRSLVLTYKGKLIDAVFHSSSGGFTEDSGKVWKKQLPYLISVKDFDQVSPNYQWSISFTQEKLRSFFPEINGLTNIELIEISPSGRLASAKFVGPNGSLALTGQEIRKRLSLKSTLIRFKFLPPDPSLESIFSSIKSFPLDLNQNKDIPTLRMRQSFGFWRDWSMFGEPYVSIALPALRIPPPVFNNDLPPVSQDKYSIESHLPDTLPPIQKEVINPTLLVRGFGAGHGVGMSQWGAYSLAEKGFSYRKILHHYYRNVRIKTFR